MLRIFQSNRLEILADELALALARCEAPTLEPHKLIIQERGLARWLSLALAQRLGVAANIEYPFPAGHLWSLFAQVLPDVPRESPFELATLTLRLTKLLEYSSAAKHPRLAQALGDHSVQRRHELAQRLASLYDRYLVYRPQWIAAWSENKRLGLGTDEEWQASLWRQVAAELPAATRTHPAARFYAALENDLAARALLPRALYLFAIQALPPAYMQLYTRLAQWTEIHLYALNPSQEYWSDIERPRDIAARAAVGEEHYGEVGNALLATMGRHGRAFFDALSETEAQSLERFAPNPNANALALLQNDILELRDRGAESVALREAEDSIEVHVCHSAMREVEVLHDRLLAAFEHDPSLQPGDVLVLVPRMENYAAAIEAVFAGAPQRLPFGIADRARSRDSGLLRNFLALLQVHQTRLESENALALLEYGAMAKRYGVAEDDFPLLRQWIAESGIRWGYDERARAALQLPATREHSWRAGFDRLLLGYAMPGEGAALFDGILPYEDIEGGNAQLVGRLKDFIDGLESVARDLGEARRVPQWVTWTERLLSEFYSFDETQMREAQEIRTAMNAALKHAREAGFEAPIPIEVWREELEARLDPAASGAGFLNGGISFAALRPLRAVPARFVALLGLNDGDLPSNPPRASFDLIEAHPQRGDRVLRDEERYALLEALLAAREHLHLSYSGRSVRDNSELPPSVLLAEILEWLRRSTHIEGGDTLARIRVEHPLQAFSARYFDGSDARLYSYAEDYAQGSRALREQITAAPAFFVRPLPAPAENPDAEISLEALQNFLRNPARFFLRDRLGVQWPQEESELEESEPFLLGGLAQAILRRECLGHLLAGRTPTESLEIARAAGWLPHGVGGDLLHARMIEELQPLAQTIAAEGELGSLHFAFDLDGRRLSGSLDGVSETRRVAWFPGPLRPQQRLTQWVRHLALNAAGIAKPGVFHTLGKSEVFVVVDHAQSYLRSLLQWMARGRTEPLPFFPRAACAYAEAAVKGKGDPLLAARRIWEGGDFGVGEREDPYFALAFRGMDDPLDQVFVELALGIYLPMLEHIDAR